MKFLVFHNAADDSYINSVENFRGAYATAQAVDMYFESPISSSVGPSAYDKITMACTNGEEDRAVEELAAAMTRNASVITIADDVNSVYACQNITSVTTISQATGGQTSGVITVGATDTTLLAGQSGSVVNINHAAVTVTLPAAAAGLNFKLILGIDTTSGAEILTATNADCFYGVIPMNTDTTDQVGVPQNITHAVAIAAPASYDAMKFVASTTTIGGVAGEIIYLTCVDDTAWHVSIPDHATTDNNPGTCALIVAR